MKILVTGTAGFIGFHLAKRLMDDGNEVVGLDCINDYYDVRVKEGRLEILSKYKGFLNHRIQLEDREAVNNLFVKEKFTHVVNLAAQAGVRYSIENPHAYIDANIVGFMNILEACRHNDIQHLLYASSSSVYGGNKEVPFKTSANVDHPVSLYAATKKSNELMAHVYSHLYNIPTTGLRFFTVYGPWGRPDMALFLFTKAIIDGQPIKVFNHGDMVRDFTYVDDIVEGIVRLISTVPEPVKEWDETSSDNSRSFAPYKVYNIGNNNPVKLEDFIDAIEGKVGKKAIRNYMPIQPGDVKKTFADVDDLVRDIDFRPETSIEDGIGHFVDWYREFYGV